jgi:hypothetical protein
VVNRDPLVLHASTIEIDYDMLTVHSIAHLFVGA